MGPEPKSVSVLLADFQFLTRTGISSLIRNTEGFSMAGYVERPDQLYDAIQQHRADLLILDFKEDQHTIDVIHHILTSTEMRVLVITNYLGQMALQQLLAMGIKAMVTKNCSENEIKIAMEAAYQGRRFFCNRVLDWMVDQKLEDNNCDPASLTPRENEVLNLVVQGKSTVEIADALHLSIHTVNTHRKNILKKLRLKSPAQLIAFALKNGMVNQ
jgi:DNA-binding NarL/FixJ family response regulator